MTIIEVDWDKRRKDKGVCVEGRLFGDGRIEPLDEELYLPYPDTFEPGARRAFQVGDHSLDCLAFESHYVIVADIRHHEYFIGAGTIFLINKDEKSYLRFAVGTVEQLELIAVSHEEDGRPQEFLLVDGDNANAGAGLLPKITLEDIYGGVVATARPD